MTRATPSAAVAAENALPTTHPAAAAFGADDEGTPGNLDVLVTERAPQGPNPLPKSAKRVWIQLEDSEEIPPTGQYVGVNGRSYMIRAGEPVHVPEEVVFALEDAVMSVPIIDQNMNVVGYRDRLRLPFRYVAAPRVPVAA